LLPENIKLQERIKKLEDNLFLKIECRAELGKEKDLPTFEESVAQQAFQNQEVELDFNNILQSLQSMNTTKAISLSGMEFPGLTEASDGLHPETAEETVLQTNESKEFWDIVHSFSTLGVEKNTEEDVIVKEILCDEPSTPSEQEDVDEPSEWGTEEEHEIHPQNPILHEEQSKASRILDAEKFSIFEFNEKTPRKRPNQEIKRGCLMGTVFYIYGDDFSMTRKLLKNIITAAGGTVTQKFSSKVGKGTDFR
jgi:hypothetical protein